MAGQTDTQAQRAGFLAKTAVLAGSGRLPEHLAAELRSQGNPPFCVSIDGEAGEWIAAFDHVSVKSVQAGVLVRALRAKGVKQVVLAGGMRRPPESLVDPAGLGDTDKLSAVLQGAWER